MPMVIQNNSASAGSPLDGNPTIGVELEVEVSREASANTKALEVLQALNAEGERVIIKHDGSLNNGFEIVTRPMGREPYHRTLWMEKFSPDIRRGLSSWDTQTCGLHTHIPQFFNSSKDASLVLAVQHPAIRNFVECLAGRDTGQWAKFYCLRNKADTLRYLSGRRGDRYVAVNTNSRHNTHEIRIFKGNTKPSSIMRAIEFAEAVWTFGNEERSIRTEEGFLSFLKRCNSNGSFTWPNLCMFVDQYGDEQKRAMREVRNRFRSRLEESDRETAGIEHRRAFENQLGHLNLEIGFLADPVLASSIVMTASADDMARRLRVPRTPCTDRQARNCRCSGYEDGEFVRCFTLSNGIPFVFEPRAGRWFAIEENAFLQMCSLVDASAYSGNNTIPNGVNSLRSIIQSGRFQSVALTRNGTNCGKVV
ncbi:MAG: hypothetical protein EBV23_12330 [Flavobacteriia bacterium]|nr:hypothetical protein [Flavobacteriia bacterium]